MLWFLDFWRHQPKENHRYKAKSTYHEDSKH